jgi:hypothetical protein
MLAAAKYYAIVDQRSSREDPAGIARRLTDADGGFQDEALSRDLSWNFTPVIVEWKRGKSSDDLIEVSEEEAGLIIERFRARWGAPG